MLLIDLYNFYKLLSIPYDKLNSINKKKINIADSIFEDLYLKKSFNHIWRKKLNSPITKVESKFNYKILEKSFDLIKIKFNYKESFILNNSPKGVISCFIDEYIIILEKSNSKFKIIFLTNKEEDPLLYDNILKKDLIQIKNLIYLDKTSIWSSKLKVLDRFYNKFLESTNFYRSPYSKSKKNNYDALKACSYAEKYALIPNDEYKSFEGSGGDCTNFVSQIIHFGGINTSSSWNPYSNAWVRVEELYSYLIYNKIAFEVNITEPMTKGSIIQFYTPKIGTFFHSGVITYPLPDGDYLYCCHSYNKLNYPLSLIYPILYPKLRNIEIL
ncbi:amidase domain-containing protein [Clostridium uliginosum]|uniref:Putative amidase domain-containing protein n=1 Tax=Clostridium uliginosum TaxID=119641 RepID=A0A1I1LVK4_9CLOT|nr:amidase domain-containing protein [Clostridium uliginosum]SFC74343.1 Putative amidase domain-containing protein [Clostridium uliginosum]